MRPWAKEGGGGGRRQVEEVRGEKGREVQVLQGGRALPRPYLKGVPAFRNPG